VRVVKYHRFPTTYGYLSSNKVLDPPIDPLTDPWEKLGRDVSGNVFSDKTLVESLFQAQDPHQKALTPEWKVLYRMKTSDPFDPTKNKAFDSVLCTNWAIQRLSGNLKKGQPFPEEDPIDSTDDTVETFIEYLNDRYSLDLEECKTDDPDRVSTTDG
jgi:hypothetical protein